MNPRQDLSYQAETQLSDILSLYGYVATAAIFHTKRIDNHGYDGNHINGSIDLTVK